MFIEDNHVLMSDVLGVSGVRHAFSTRLGGVSVNAATASMNVAFGTGDDADTVRRNIDILAHTVGSCAADTVCAPQIHSDRLRYVGAANRGEGVLTPSPVKCDGFYTAERGIALLVRTADCAPILLAGVRDDASPAICAVHAGWRGAAAGIALMAVAAMRSLGVAAGDIRAAIGPCASFGNYEVGEDMRDEVISVAGADFATRHIREHDGALHADVAAMNREFLLAGGLAEENIDVAGICTVTGCARFHSHRATKGNRGTMGNMICIE